MDQETFFRKGIDSGLSDEQIKSGWAELTSTDISTAEKSESPQFNLQTSEEIRNSLDPTMQSVVDNSTDSIGTLAKESVNNFMIKEFQLRNESYSAPLNIGRKMYKNNKLMYPELQALLQADIKSGEITKRMEGVRYSQYGATGPVEKELREFLDSDFMADAAFYMKTPAKGYLKAASRLGVGTASLFLPKKVEEFVGIDKAREQLSYVDKYQQEYIDEAFMEGDYGRFMSLNTGRVLGDTFGNLMLMKQGIGVANKLMGGKMTLVAKQKTWANVAKNTAKRSAVIAGMNFLSTDGTLAERTKSATLTAAYMNSPVLSSLAKTNFGAVLSDIAINSVISSVYDPEEGWQLGGQYKGLVEESKELAGEMGDPDGWKNILVAKLIPIAGPDAVFGALSRSYRANERASGRAKTTEAARLMQPLTEKSFANRKSHMKKKYGDDWLKKMDDIDRIEYENARQIDAIVKDGELPPLFENIQKTVTPRVNPQEMARLVESDEKLSGEVAEISTAWRDKDGKLVESSESVRVDDGKVEIIEKPAQPAQKDGAEKVADVSAQKEIKTRESLVKKITKAPTKNTAAEYAEAIQDLQDMILTDTSAKTKWRLNNQAKALENNPEIKLPKKAIAELQKTSVDELSTENLTAIAIEVDRLSTQGKTLHKLRQKQWKSEVAGVTEKIKSTAKKPKNVEKIITDESDKRKFKGVRYVMGVGALRPWNLVDMMDGGRARYDGAGHELFINRANEKFSDYQVANDTRVRGGEAVVRANDMSVKDLNAKYDVGGQKLTLDKLLSVYGSSKNKLMHNAVLYGNFKGNRDNYNKAVAMVENNQRWKNLADYIVYDYASNYDRVRKAVIRNENKILGQEENYIPMERMGVERVDSFDQIRDALFERDTENKKLPDNKFTIERINVPKDMQKPVKLGLYANWERNVGAQERYINMFDQVSRMNSVLADSELRDQLKSAYGQDYLESVDGYVKAYGNPMSIYEKGQARYSRKLRKNIAQGVLGYNVLTITKQIPSILLYAGQGGGKNMLTALDDFNSSWTTKNGKISNDLIDFVEAKDPQVKHAHIERELADLKITDRSKFDRIVAKIGEPGMQGIVKMDKAVRTIGWYSTYMRGLEKGMTEQKAIEYARNATNRTQPAASAKDLPDIYKKGEAMNWMMMFTNQINQLWNLSTYQMPRSVMAKDPGAAMGIATGLIANALVMHVLMHKSLPDSEEDITQMLIEQSAGKVPLVGSAITSSMQGYDAENPAIGLLGDSAQRGWKAIQSGEEEDYENAIKEIVENLGTANGIPITSGKRFLKFIEKGEPIELIGGKAKK